MYLIHEGEASWKAFKKKTLHSLTLLLASVLEQAACQCARLCQAVPSLSAALGPAHKD